VRGILEDIVFLALRSRYDLVDFASDRDEGINESVNFVFGLRLCGFDQPTSVDQSVAHLGIEDGLTWK
jgi:hypothetical protein